MANDILALTNTTPGREVRTAVSSDQPYFSYAPESIRRGEDGIKTDRHAFTRGVIRRFQEVMEDFLFRDVFSKWWLYQI